MEEIELNSKQWRQLAKQLDNESRRTESFPVQKRLRRQADDALRRAVAMETQVALAKGDVSGHEFHGNQYGGGGGGKSSVKASEVKVGQTIEHPSRMGAWKVGKVERGDFLGGQNKITATHEGSGRTSEIVAHDNENITVHKGDVSGHEFHGNQWSSFGSGGGKFSAQAKGAVETKVGPGKATLADAQANGLVKDNGNGTHSWSSTLTTDRADGRADTKSGRGTASSKGEAQQAAHDWAKGQGFSTNLHKGDVSGHEFHGNQWGGGGGSGGRAADQEHFGGGSAGGPTISASQSAALASARDDVKSLSGQTAGSGTYGKEWSGASSTTPGEKYQSVQMLDASGKNAGTLTVDAHPTTGDPHFTVSRNGSDREYKSLGSARTALERAVK